MMTILDLKPLISLTKEDFYQLCRANPEVPLELSRNGELIITSPVGGEVGNKEADLIFRVGFWNRQSKLGLVFSSSEVRYYNTNLTEMVKILGSRPINVEAKAMAGDNIRQQGNFGIGNMSGGEIKDSKVAGVINEAEQQNLAQAAAEIQRLLEQLENSYSTETTAG
ncbi:MAG: Uma2 family endonuclease, partial [Spirulinaceae cyanobacterium]